MATQELIQEAEQRMQKATDVMRRELSSMRAGRATPALLDRVQVLYYGVPTPINQVATISAPEARLLVIQPWDRNVLGDIEKAILKSDLGLTPNNDGQVIRISIPQLTKERRTELVKVVRKKVEDCRVAIRNIRRETNEQTKAMLKAGEISEDEQRRLQDQIQKLTDRFIGIVDKIGENKVAEIMEV
ncbi:MAG: ribosome recycling factor [Clostridia bacterium]|nr:ribosome recycling factor [Clostridia bacterium]